MKLILLFLLLLPFGAFAATDTLSVHLFTSKQQADSAINVINRGEGIPHDVRSTTTTYAISLLYNGQWYIAADDVTVQYLGAAVDMIRTIPSPTIK